MPDSAVSRRNFLLRCAALGALTPLAACGGSDEQTPVAAGGVCTDVSGLEASQVEQRNAMITSLNYVEETPIPEKRCDNCKFWQAAVGGADCGGCQLILGPIAPGGYCTSWLAVA